MDSVMELLEVCFKAIHFQFGDILPTEGRWTVVSSLSVVVSKNCMKFLNI